MSKYVEQIQTMLKDKGFYQGVIDGVAGQQTVNAVSQALGVELPKEQPSNELQLSANGMRLIKEFEGFRSSPYKDAVGVPTIGYGNTYYLDGRKVTLRDKPLTQQEAHDLKMAITNRDFAPAVRKALAGSKVAITQNMFDACVSLAYNIGVSAFAKSSVVRQLNAGNKQKAGDAFLMWDKAGGKTLLGLTRRRNAERKLFLA